MTKEIFRQGEYSIIKDAPHFVLLKDLKEPYPIGDDGSETGVTQTRSVLGMFKSLRSAKEEIREQQINTIAESVKRIDESLQLFVRHLIRKELQDQYRSELVR